MKYGWKPSLRDFRDFKMRSVAPVALPSFIDLRTKCPAVYNQGQAGSCTANAIAGAIEFDLLKQGKADFMPSRLFIYYNEREMEGSVGQDNGAAIRDGIKSINQVGICDEILWPYDIDQLTVKPSQAAYDAAKTDLISVYKMIGDGNINLMKETLAVGFPFVFGFTVFSAFESSRVAESGVLNMPDSSEQVVGGHAVLCVGYDDAQQVFIVRNSWGKDWGMKGYFTMPYQYMNTMGSDIWVINAV